MTLDILGTMCLLITMMMKSLKSRPGDNMLISEFSRAPTEAKILVKILLLYDILQCIVENVLSI